MLYFGTYQERYPRNAQVISALRRAGMTVDERHVPVWDQEGEVWRARGRDVIQAVGGELRLLTGRRGGYDAVIVGYPSQLDVVAARRVARGAPVVLNPLISWYDTLVTDRGRFSPRSLPARALEGIDRFAFRHSDVVVADTQAHADFMAELAGLDRSRVAVCMVGAEDAIFTPGWAPAEPWTAVFIGKLIPLHGVDTIVEAARLAADVAFRIIGSGQMQHLLEAAPANLDRISWVDYHLLPQELHRAGCALGVFGTSPKAARVIPNKAFQALACATPLITADTPASRELLVDGESALLVPAGNAEALAEAVRRLATDRELARRLSRYGRAVYAARASEDALGQEWKRIITAAVAARS